MELYPPYTKCYFTIGNHNEGSSGKWRHCASKNVGVSEETLALTSNLIGRRVRKCVILSWLCSKEILVNVFPLSSNYVFFLPIIIGIQRFGWFWQPFRWFNSRLFKRPNEYGDWPSPVILQFNVIVRCEVSTMLISAIILTCRNNVWIF